MSVCVCVCVCVRACVCVCVCAGFNWALVWGDSPHCVPGGAAVEIPLFCSGHIMHFFSHFLSLCPLPPPLRHSILGLCRSFHAALPFIRGCVRSDPTLILLISAELISRTSNCVWYVLLCNTSQLPTPPPPSQAQHYCMPSLDCIFFKSLWMCFDFRLLVSDLCWAVF